MMKGRQGQGLIMRIVVIAIRSTKKSTFSLHGVIIRVAVAQGLIGLL